MKLTEMREVLAREDIQLTKSLGQNFLHDGNQVRRIVKAGELSKADKVLEIGPGLGPLTELLLESAGQVLAIEKDGRLVEVLKKRFETFLATEKLETGETPVLRLLHEDALEFLKHDQRDWSEWKLVANLPYSVASPILVELARGQRSPRRLVATLQLEVARRLVARAGDDDYGILGLLMQLDFEPLDWFKIPATCFFPQPEVDSACIVLERRAKPFLPDELRENFRALVKLAFSQRRKMMFKLLKQNWPQDRLERAFAEAGLPAQTRAEAVTIEQFVLLTSLLR